MKNSSEKINQSKKCQVKRYDESLCNRPLYDEKHCIFHSHKFPKVSDGFNKAFWKEFQRQKKEDKCYDFSRFTFLDTMSFKGIKFDKSIYLNGAIFAGDITIFEFTQFTGEIASFDEVQFKSIRTYFTNAQFMGDLTTFGNTQFTSEITSFIGAQFIGKATLFDETKFKSKKTLFDYSQFKGGTNSFAEAQFSGEETSFDGAQFTGETASFYATQFTSETTSFQGARFTGKISFHLAILKNVWNLFESLTRRKWLFLKKYLIKDWRFYLQEETANRHPLVKRMVNDAWYLDEFKKRYPILYFLWKITSDCGQNFSRWLALSLGIALVFGFIFMRIGPEAFELRHFPTKFSFFYYSIVTFTTLGFGDITPTNLTTEILVTIEVILGYIMLGGLISIFANKLARRS